MLTPEFQSAAPCGQYSNKRCVEVAIRNDVVLVRDSKEPSKDALQFDRDEWSAFVAGAKSGQFDLPG